MLFEESALGADAIFMYQCGAVVACDADAYGDDCQDEHGAPLCEAVPGRFMYEAGGYFKYQCGSAEPYGPCSE